jgi:TPR repeat protein
MYLRGEGVAHDYGEARQWFLKAAKHGNADAIRLYNKANDLGSAMATYNLGLMYLNGRGVNRNATVARDLISKAAAAGIPQASQKLRELGVSP